jgi:hypothetical protein
MPQISGFQHHLCERIFFQEFSETFNKALLELCPNLFIRKDLGLPRSDYSQCRWLELRKGAKAPRISVLIEIGWRPPLTGAAVETLVTAGILTPELLQDRLEPERDQFSRASRTPLDVTGSPVVEWKFAQRRLLTFLKVMYWRPYTFKLADETK